MKSNEIREKFLKYFEDKGHKRLPGASLIPSDPSVLLTLAGMLQFKQIFLGMEKSKNKRVTTVQKCIRMNDVANVGKTSRHHTFFEMLGNFSFGDYFKKEAIIWAWDLITNEFKISKDKLLIAVYEKDDESYKIWNEIIGLKKEKIFRLGEENNFWAAGPTGPCGPCSEIYYDMGKDKGCGKPGCEPGCDCDRFLELWNLVFIEFDRNEKGKLNPLPSKNIDTGMGLERIASVLQGVSTNFDTDLFMPIIEDLRSLLKGKKPDIHHPGQSIISERIIADHARAATHMIADGILPSNESRGYVLRSLIRRAVRHGRILGIKEPFIHRLTRSVINVNGVAYPEIAQQEAFIRQVVLSEEEHFAKTLEQGMEMIAEIVKKCISESKKLISGRDVFILHDTYGFPYDLTKEIALESGLEVDEAGFQKEMEQQKKRGRTAGIGAQIREKVQELSKFGPTKFEGYGSLSADSKILYVDKKENIVVLEKTTFYPEGGGQAGDTGKFFYGLTEMEVLDTFGAIGGVIVHKLKDVKSLKEKSSVKAVVDKAKREATAKNHTSTHLLQAALKEVFGKHVKQTGSYVGPDRFRFDFTHFKEIPKEDLEKVERRVNEKIKEKLKVEIEEVSLEEARKRDAVMLFDEKYGEKVRMISVGKFSKELCGGTHVKNTSDISFFKILSEGAVSAGVRRIEAKTSDAARAYLNDVARQLWDKNQDMFGTYKSLELKSGLLSSKPETYYQFFRITKEEIDMFGKAVKEGNIFVINRIHEDFKKKNEGLFERIKEMESESKRSQVESFKAKIDQYEKEALLVNDIKIIRETFRITDIDVLRDMSDLIRNKFKRIVSILFTIHENKVNFVLALSKDLVDEGLNAGTIVKEAAKAISGGGGGRPHIAEAGGNDPSKIDDVVTKVAEIIKNKKSKQ